MAICIHAGLKRRFHAGTPNIRAEAPPSLLALPSSPSLLALPSSSSLITPCGSRKAQPVLQRIAIHQHAAAGSLQLGGGWSSFTHSLPRALSSSLAAAVTTASRAFYCHLHAV
mmetsp:Transcript_34552/g.75918  ORF Transcript_34552/g.75918 Transcript_34552/m.75918 type:complete len:113 (+) Transcript_34552:391-729(+)